MRTTDIATGAPAWAYILLVALILLGVRRLKTRETPLPIALLPSVAFLIWSIFGAVAFAGRVGSGAAAGIWLAGAAIGAASGTILPDPRGMLLPDRRVRQPGSWLPLILYIGVFTVRFGCGAWAAIVPAQAIVATAVGVAVSAVMTARLLIGVTRWRAEPR